MSRRAGAAPQDDIRGEYAVEPVVLESDLPYRQRQLREVWRLMAALYAAWKGHDSAGIFRASSTDGRGWSPQEHVAGVGTSHGPALVVFEHRLYMFWKGLGDDTAIWWSVTRDGQHWTDQDTAPSLGQGLSQFRTSESPAVAVFGDRLHLFWKGSDDLGIWHASAFPPGRPVDGRERLFWDDHGRLDYVDPGTGGSFDYTRNAPAALAMQQMYLAGQNEDNDGIFAWSSADGIFWDPEQIVDVPGVGTSNGPALVNNATTFLGEPDKLLMFWKGAADDSSIWHSSSSDAGRNWTTQRPVPNVGTSHRPALATWGEDVYVIWKRNDAGLCWAVFSPFAGDPGVWLHPVTRDPVRPGEPKIPSVGTSHRPALTVFEPRPAVVGHFHPGRFGHATHR